MTKHIPERGRARRYPRINAPGHFVLKMNRVRILWTVMNTLGTTINQFWERIFDKRRRYSDITIEENFMKTPSGTSVQSITNQRLNYLPLNYEGNFNPDLTFSPYFQDVTPIEMDYISDSVVKTGKKPLHLKINSLKKESANKCFYHSHRITSAAQMKNHPLRKSTSGFQRQSSEGRNDKTKISQQNSSQLSLENLENSGVKSKKVIFGLNSCKNIPSIRSIYKENMFSIPINDLTSGDFDKEPFDNKHDSSMKIETEEGEIAEGEDNFPEHYKIYPVSTQMEDNDIDVTSYLKDMIRKINRLSKGKKILELINDELVLSDGVPSSSNQYDKRDDTWIKFISEDKTIKYCTRNVEDDVTNSSPKFLSESKTTNFGNNIEGISKNGIRFENSEIKNEELFSKYALDDLVKEDDIKFQDKTIKRVGPVPTNKIYKAIAKSEKNISSTENNLMTLNINNYDFHGDSDLWEWKVKSDIIIPDVKTGSNKNSKKSIKNFQVKADDPIVEKRNPMEKMEKPEHMIMGCCEECMPKPYSYKYVVYNIPRQEENGTNLFEKNIGKGFLKYENAVLESPVKNTEKIENIFESSSLNRKPCCSKTDRQDRFSSSVDSLAYGLHKNVFKKLNPRSLLFQTPASKNRIRVWEGVKKECKSSEILLENGSREFLKKTSARQLIKEIHDDENPLISLENKSSESLISKSIFKYADLSSSVEWQSFFGRTFKTESVNECGTEDCLELTKHTQFMSMPKNLPPKLSALGRSSESFLQNWINSRKKTEVQKSMKKLCNKIRNA
ncbi:hypothetical protein HNY73_014002 [Argiope bruennichi]|uniref:Uncharacterized protein n=1 Tax=Argiope bruennichi TaxID=94029 RepID=A0A8T0ESU4_ARGBR|nr:hypothetical protein HNY73_014002 [Argiope bruennichi]